MIVMLRVGLTGGIGAGKSTVATRLVEHGAVLIDADAIAREVVEPGSEGLAAVAAEFGDEILAADGSLDRPALAAVAFADDDARRRLNAIMHPLVGSRTADLVAAAPQEAVVVHDVPLLVENGMAPMFHLVIVVDADTDVRVDRLTGHREMSAADARARIAAQASTAQRHAVADVWLDNSGARDEVQAAVDALWADRLVPYEANVRLRRVVDAGLHGPGGDPTPSDATERLLQRVRYVAGAHAASVEPDAADDDTFRFHLHPAADADVADLAVALADGGFPQLPEQQYEHGSADPARAVRVSVQPPAERDG